MEGMSWLLNAVNKAVEVSGNTTLTVKSYADTVIHHAGQAVAGGAKILQDRMGMKNYKSFKQTVERLEEVALSCRGVERVQLLRRWLVLLKEIDKASRANAVDDRSLQQTQSCDEHTSPKTVPMILFFDPDMGGEPVNFRDVFLHSQALECATLSTILEAPNEEEVSLLLEIFRLCFTGGKEVHNAIISSIQDLAKAFSGYQDEVLAKREELLQFARSAISGLKINADIERVDAEASELRQKIDGTEAFHSSGSCDKISQRVTLLSVEDLNEALEEVRMCSRLEYLLLKKKSINPGDSSETHSQKIDKLKVLAESLANSSSKAEKRIADHRHQKEEALNFRVTKANEVGEIEKELLAEITGLEKQRDQLEAELKKVNISLSAAMSRLNKTREEMGQFDEASNQMVVHFQTKEDELSKSVASCKIESGIIHTWINFLEDTWRLRSSFTELKEQQTKDELEKCGNCFVKLTKYHLSIFKEELGPSISRIGTFVANLKKINERSDMMSDADKELSNKSNPKKLLEEEYLSAETKITTTFSVVDYMKLLFYSEQGNILREDPEVKELFCAIEKMRGDFQSIERPSLEIEIPEEKLIRCEEKLKKSSSGTTEEALSPVSWATSPKLGATESPNSLPVTRDVKVDRESEELAELEEDFGEVRGEYSTEETGGWEFDELEQELK